jgi:hypothetical protein
MIENYKPKKSVPLIVYLLGIICFIPVVGVVIGIAYILIGILQYKSKWIIFIGLAGIATTFIFYEITNEQGGPFDKLMLSQAQEFLNSLPDKIEFYKWKHGQYPDSIEQLQKDDQFVFIFDPLSGKYTKDHNSRSVDFFYQKVNDKKYYLFSVGFDGKPFTKDDLYPQVLAGQDTGLIRKNY